MKKEIVLIMLVSIMAFSLIGCGSSVPVMNEKIAEESTGIVEGNTEEFTGAEETETTAIPAPTDTSTPTSTPDPTAKPTTEPTATTEPESTEPPHVHDFKVESSTEATCAVAGERKLVCECGESQIESVPATGNHNWKEVTNIVHHEELGHVETTEVQVQVGTTTRTEYACANCGARFDSPEAKVEHCKATGDIEHAFARTIAYDYTEPIYDTKTETVWVVDTPAWDETVVTGYTCTGCGATK